MKNIKDTNYGPYYRALLKNILKAQLKTLLGVLL